PPASRCSRSRSLLVSTPFLTLSKIDHAIGSKTILDGIDLTLQTGRIYGLVGPNGSGKSTLLKIIARQIAPKSGCIPFDGKAEGKWGTRPFARHVAYMPQFTPATDGMTVRELVALGRFPWHGTLGRFTATDRDMVEEAISRTELEDFA